MMMLAIGLIGASAPTTQPTLNKEAKMTSEPTKIEAVTKAEQEFLLNLARQTLEKQVTENKRYEPDLSKVSENLKKKMGCFVTLNKGPNHELRGCIGYIAPFKPLYEAIVDNAISAAIHDNRFPVVGPSELKDITIEISVLTEPVPLEFDSPEDLLKKLRPHIDGVNLYSGFHRATYLPQVWEHFDKKELFLSTLCQKGGASFDCWKQKGLRVETYQAQVFSENR
jgi:AmmeMemoRadiSam system protein A